MSPIIPPTRCCQCKTWHHSIDEYQYHTKAHNSRMNLSGIDIHRLITPYSEPPCHFHCNHCDQHFYSKHDFADHLIEQHRDIFDLAILNAPGFEVYRDIVRAFVVEYAECGRWYVDSTERIQRQNQVIVTTMDCNTMPPTYRASFTPQYISVDNLMKMTLPAPPTFLPELRPANRSRALADLDFDPDVEAVARRLRRRYCC